MLRVAIFNTYQLGRLKEKRQPYLDHPASNVHENQYVQALDQAIAKTESFLLRLEREPAALLKTHLKLFKKYIAEFEASLPTKPSHDPFLRALFSPHHLRTQCMGIEHYKLEEEQSPLYRKKSEAERAQLFAQARYKIFIGYLSDLTKQLQQQKGLADSTEQGHYDQLLAILQRTLVEVYNYQTSLQNLEVFTFLELAEEQHAYARFKANHVETYTISQAELDYQRAILHLEAITHDEHDIFHEQARAITRAMRYDIVAANPNYPFYTNLLNLVTAYITSTNPAEKAHINRQLLAKMDAHPTWHALLYYSRKVVSALAIFAGLALCASAIAIAPIAFGLLAPVSVLGITIGATLLTQNIALGLFVGGGAVSYGGYRFFKYDASKQLLPAAVKQLLAQPAPSAENPSKPLLKP